MAASVKLLQAWLESCVETDQRRADPGVHLTHWAGIDPNGQTLVVTGGVTPHYLDLGGIMVDPRGESEVENEPVSVMRLTLEGA